MNFPHRNIFVVIFSLIGVISGLIITNQTKLNRPTAGLKIETTPASQVFVDNKQIGITPIDQQFPPGEVLLKLVPDSPSASGQVFQTKIRLTDKVYTLVRRDFADSETTAAGETVTLIPISEQISPLSIVSDPDSASVHIDSEPQGFTPLNLDSLPPGNHQIDISAPGFVSRSISLKAVAGYKLQMVVKLSESGDQVSLPDPATSSGSVQTSARDRLSDQPVATASSSLVRILSTPTGFLRVRSGPSTAAVEVARVNPGDKLPLLEKQQGWFKVSLSGAGSATSSGWISTEYSSLEP